MAATNLTATATYVVDNLQALQKKLATGTLGKIYLSDSGTPTLNISVDLYLKYNTVLTQIVSPFKLQLNSVSAADAITASGMAGVASIIVSDKAANVASRFGLRG